MTIEWEAHMYEIEKDNKENKWEIKEEWKTRREVTVRNEKEIMLRETERTKIRGARKGDQGYRYELSL